MSIFRLLASRQLWLYISTKLETDTYLYRGRYFLFWRFLVEANETTTASQRLAVMWRKEVALSYATAAASRRRAW